MSRYAKMDPAHFLDGLFVPTSQKGSALYDVESEWDGQYLRFEGVQLSAKHQSLLLAIAARSARSDFGAKKVIEHDTDDKLAQKQLSLLDQKGLAADRKPSDLRCPAYGLLVDAGMDTSQKGYAELIRLLHQMSSVSMYRGKVKGMSPSIVKKNDDGGGTSKLLSFQHDDQELDGKIFISLNWRMTASIIGTQNFQVSLYERKMLSDSPVAKVLHAWLSSRIQLGGSLMAGNGAQIDTLVAHVYGRRPCSADTMTQRRGYIKTALSRINEIKGWACTVEGNHALISRPKELPWEQETLSLEVTDKKVVDTIKKVVKKTAKKKQ